MLVADLCPSSSCWRRNVRFPDQICYVVSEQRLTLGGLDHLLEPGRRFTQIKCKHGLLIRYLRLTRPWACREPGRTDGGQEHCRVKMRLPYAARAHTNETRTLPPKPPRGRRLRGLLQAVYTRPHAQTGSDSLPVPPTLSRTGSTFYSRDLSSS